MLPNVDLYSRAPCIFPDFRFQISAGWVQDAKGGCCDQGTKVHINGKQKSKRAKEARRTEESRGLSAETSLAGDKKDQSQAGSKVRHLDKSNSSSRHSMVTGWV